jgi:AcrR family transcriptional regulator
MSIQSSHFSHGDDDDVDPRRIRSRNRLLDAAETLLRNGGIEAVTIDAVTKTSKVARTTLYRHFNNSSDLLAATFERLLPKVTPPPPTNGTLRERLIELLARQAALFAEAPLHAAALAWISLGGATSTAGDDSDENSTDVLRVSIIEQYCKPFEAILQSRETRAELDDFDPQLAMCQLIGPLAFARMTGLRAITEHDCVHIVDDFLSAHHRGTQKKDASDDPRRAARNDRTHRTSQPSGRRSAPTG